MITASKDGTIYCWTIPGDSKNPDEKLSYVADYTMELPITKVKWLTQTVIMVTTTDGDVYTLKLEKDD